MTDASFSAGTAVSAHELEDRAGYDPAFLGVQVPMPVLTTPEPTVELHYLHYSVLFRPDRRLAAVTALTMDGARLVQGDRTDERHLDPRLGGAPPGRAPGDADKDPHPGHPPLRGGPPPGGAGEGGGAG